MTNEKVTRASVLIDSLAGTADVDCLPVLLKTFHQ